MCVLHCYCHDVSECIWLLDVTCNDIQVIYVTAHRCAGGPKKKLGLRSGYQCHIHFVGFFNVPVEAPTRGQPFYGYSKKPLHFSRLLLHTWGYGGRILNLTPQVPEGGGLLSFNNQFRRHFDWNLIAMNFIPSDC